MAAVSLTGADVVVIDGNILNDLADGDCVMIEFPNPKAEGKVGKNNNAIIAQNNMGQVADVKIRLLSGSSDDKTLNSLLAQQDQNFPATDITGTFTKRVGDGQGNISAPTWQFAAGVFVKNVEAKTNADGDTEQSVSVYHIRFFQFLGRAIQ